MQLTGTKDGMTRHTNIIGMAVPVSLSGDANWPTLPTAFSDALDRAEDAADRAESAATHGPRISGTNTWEVWDPDKGQYVDTMVDASGKTGPQGPAGVDGTTPDIQIGTVTTLDPGEDATASISGTAAEPVLSLGIPKGAKGDKGDTGGGSDISLGLTSATVGQSIKVKAVDDEGRPTEWEPVTGLADEDMSLIFDDTVPQDVARYDRDTDANGQPFNLRKAVVMIWTPKYEERDSSDQRQIALRPGAFWSNGNIASISNTIKSSSDSIGKYNEVWVEMCMGYQVVTDALESQNSTNVFGNMIQRNEAGVLKINFYTDKEKIMQIRNTQEPITCVSIFSYTTICVPKNTRIRLYGVRA